jgi:hypothetical protein
MHGLVEIEGAILVSLALLLTSTPTAILIVRQ